jgi:hypothetical protein
VQVVELAGNAALDNKMHRIKPRHIMLAIRNDEELSRVLSHVTISEGGVLPNIQVPSTFPRISIASWLLQAVLLPRRPSEHHKKGGMSPPPE